MTEEGSTKGMRAKLREDATDRRSKSRARAHWREHYFAPSSDASKPHLKSTFIHVFIITTLE